MSNHFGTPTVFVIFGGTGNLAMNKLYRALFGLYKGGVMPQKFHIIGVAHTDLESAQFRRNVAEQLGLDRDDVFIKKISYVRGSFGSQALYKELSEEHSQKVAAIGQCVNTLFHLATSPKYYGEIIENLVRAGSMEACSDETGWSRILIEKPFGATVTAAQNLENYIQTVLREDQVYRIDHYLGKETVQNILAFRFGNYIFDALWNRTHISAITVRLHEELDASERGQFYDDIGALYDVGENHMMRMLALVTMEPIQTPFVQNVQREISRLLDVVYIEEKGLMRGQYVGYTEAVGVAEKSQTETFFRLPVRIDNPRWQGVPITLESGKALAKKKTEIEVTFRDSENELWEKVQGSNKITFSIAPEENIAINFFALAHGLSKKIEEQNFHFRYGKHKDHAIHDEYAKLIYDAICGDRSMFAEFESIRLSLQLVENVHHAWKDKPLMHYQPGTNPS